MITDIASLCRSPVRLAALVAAAFLVLPAAACTKKTAVYCDGPGDCYSGVCDVGNHVCIETIDGAQDTDASSDGPQLPDGPSPCVWSTPVIVPNVNTTGFEGMATEGPDGLKLYLTRTISVATDSDIYVASRSDTDLAFGTPVRLSAVDTVDVFDDAPELSATGLELFFRRSVPEDPMSGIWTATRTTPNGTFNGPQSLGIDGYSPTISGDGLTLYYVTAASPTNIQSISRTSIGGLWGPSEDVLVTNYRGIDVSSDELRILLSDGPVGFPDAPVAIVERATKDASFGAPAPLLTFSVADDTASTKSGRWSRMDRLIYLEMRLPAGQGATDTYLSQCE